VDLADHEGFRYTAYQTTVAFNNGHKKATGLRYNQVTSSGGDGWWWWCQWRLVTSAAGGRRDDER
jgi:hypothetical protein